MDERLSRTVSWSEKWSSKSEPGRADDPRTTALDDSRLPGCRGTQHAPLRPPTPAPFVLDGAANHVRVAVLVRVWRRDWRVAPTGRELQGLPPPGNLHPVHLFS